MKRNDLDELLNRYGCGPVKFTGTDDALVERRLVFNQVIDPNKAGPREHFEALGSEGVSNQLNESQFPDGIRRVFAEAFRVADIAESLASFDETTPSPEVTRLLDKANCEVAGVRREGQVWGFVVRPLPDAGLCGAAATPLDNAAVLADSAPLTAAVGALSSAPWVFVTVFGRVAGIVTRADLAKPPVRMWLFGMVTLIELRYARLIESYHPAESWRQYISAGRLKKAEELLAERQRRHHQGLTLLDCLQLSDKGQIVARDEQLRQLTIFSSRSQAEEGIKMLEGLRNSLAHAQDIVACDWEAIVRLSGELERVLKIESAK